MTDELAARRKIARTTLGLEGGTDTVNHLHLDEPDAIAAALTAARDEVAALPDDGSGRLDRDIVLATFRACIDRYVFTPEEPPRAR